MIAEILEGDYSSINDVELFKKQYESFDLWKYPGLEEARRIIHTGLPNYGTIKPYSDWLAFCNKYGMTGISSFSFYNNFTSRFNKEFLKYGKN